jgi:dienelactone hydrolase
MQIGCMGFCMGGALTLAMSQSGKIDCGAPCYGLPSEGHGEVSQATPQTHTKWQ